MNRGWGGDKATWAALALGAFYALPVLLVAFPPMADLPHNEAVVGLWRHFFDPAFVSPNVYRTELGAPNQLFFWLSATLARFVPVDVACKLVIAAVEIALPLAALRLARYLKAPLFLVGLVAPLGLGWLFQLGLVPNLLGLVAFMATLPTLDRFVCAPSWKAVPGVLAGLAFAYTAHQFVLMVEIALLVTFAILAPLRPRAIALALGTAASASGAAYCLAPRLPGNHLFYRAFWRRVTELPLTLFGSVPAWVGHVTLSAALAVGVLFAMTRGRLRVARSTPPGAGVPWRRVRELAFAARFELLAMFLISGYFLAPTEMPNALGPSVGLTNIHQRFLHLGFVLMLLALGRDVDAARMGPIVRRGFAIARAFAPIVAVGMPLALAPTFVASHKAYSSLNRILPHVKTGQAIFGLPLLKDPRRFVGALFVPGLGGENHVVAARGGRSVYNFADSALSPVRYRDGQDWPVLRANVSGAPLYPQFHFSSFRYVLLYIDDPARAVRITRALSAESRLLANEGSWFLYESTLEVIPIDSKEPNLSIPPPESLDSREKRMIDQESMKPK